jgi:hypothetical protein
MKCAKCHGKMHAEKFYGRNGTFHGWRCLLCGDIIDPVILLHRLSGESRIAIPERNEDLMRLIQKYLRVKGSLKGRESGMRMGIQ